MDTKHNIENIRLTAAEIGMLFVSYMNNCMSLCVLKYFSEKAKDPEVKSLVNQTIEISSDKLQRIKNIFKTVNHPIPYGFTEDDVNVNTERLFSDSFMLYYLKFNAQFGLISYSTALTQSAREDVRLLFSDCIDRVKELCNKVEDILLAKGLFIRSPYIQVPNKIDFVHKQSFMSGFIGEKRPLNALEISHIYTAIETNLLGKSLMLGFSQVAKDMRVKEYCDRGKRISTSHIDTFSDLLKEDDLNVPSTWDMEVTTSTESPFSDKLITFHTTALITYGMGRYGLSASQCIRKDVSLNFIQAAAEVAQYAKDGLDIMLDNNWLERIPEAVDRKEIVGV